VPAMPSGSSVVVMWTAGAIVMVKVASAIFPL
jgi:hypothetical protein